MIRFESVSKTYQGGFQALKNVSFAIAKGEMIFIAGHSGAGKSTVLKLISGITRPSGGRVLNCVGVAPTAEAARQKAYDAIAQVQFDGITYRRDIGL